MLVLRNSAKVFLFALAYSAIPMFQQTDDVPCVDAAKLNIKRSGSGGLANNQDDFASWLQNIFSASTSAEYNKKRKEAAMQGLFFGAPEVSSSTEKADPASLKSLAAKPEAPIPFHDQQQLSSTGQGHRATVHQVKQQSKNLKVSHRPFVTAGSPRPDVVKQQSNLRLKSWSESWSLPEHQRYEYPNPSEI